MAETATSPPTTGHSVQRQPPVVVIVPPLPGGTIPAVTAPALIGMVVVPLLLAALLGPDLWRWRLLCAAGVMTLVGTTLFLIIAWFVRRERQRIDAFVTATKHDFSQPAQRELRKLWSGFTSVTPNLSRVRAALREHGLMQPGRATVLVFDTMEPREPSPYSFEPVILTPTQRVGTQIWTVAACMLVVLVWLFKRLTGFGPRFSLVACAYAFVIGVVAAWQWYLMVVAAPEYVRLAPGVIQFLRFERGRTKPAFRSYGMDEGTLLCFLRFGNTRSLLISTATSGESIKISDMLKSADAQEDFWRAILCTAPTPPLSEDELVG